MTKRKKPTFKSLNNYEPADAEFLWNPYIPLGQVTLIEGDPGLGKSWLTMDIAACISTGDPLPGQKKLRQGRILLLSAEDDPSITLRPRLDASCGDPSQVFCATEHFTFDEAGLQRLRSNVRKHRPLLVIIDPIVAYIGSDVDMHRANETRPLFKELANIAEKYNCAIVVVRHLRKAGGDNASYLGLGSIDIIASVRSTILVAKDLDDPTNVRCLIHHKANISAKGKTLLYRIVPTKKRPGSELIWAGEAEYDIEEYMKQRNKDPGAPDDKRQIAVGLLTKLLENGPKPAAEIEATMATASVSGRTLKRAKRELGVTSEKSGDRWIWRLP
jgi:hypothetical protein